MAARASTRVPSTQQQRSRNESESWVEISSQPSSSSLSSIGDEIVLTGLRVQHDSNNHHQRRNAKRSRNSYLSQQSRQNSHSSQEEYEESESEEDRVLTSSNEQLIPPRRPAQLSAQQETYHTSDDDDDDGNGTALGVGRARSTEITFMPQPNAFSHPPSLQRNTSYQPPYSSRAPGPQPRHNSYSGRTAATRQQQHTPFSGTTYSPSSQDHDAVLRASLTTLLSCAAAARGLPKQNQSPIPQWGVPQPGQAVNQEPSGDVGGLRLVPESALDEDPQPSTRTRTCGPSTRDRRTPMRTESSGLERGSRVGQPQQQQRRTPSQSANTTKEKDRARLLKKKRTSGASSEDVGYLTSFGLGYNGISPTVLTWVVSAGVVVLVGVIGFGAGYAMGREAGLQEGSFVAGGGGVVVGRNGAAGCAQEVVKSATSGGGGGGGGGLRKLREAITA